MGGIDSLFDFAEGVVSALESVSGVSPQSPAQARDRAPIRRTPLHARAIHPSAPTGRQSARRQIAAPGAALARTRVVARADAFQVVDAIDAETGAQSWVVTDGSQRVECGSEEMANRVAKALSAEVTRG